MLQHDADDLLVGDDIFLVVDRAVFLMAQVCFGPFAASLCTSKRAGDWPIGTRENGESMKCQVCGTEMPEGSRFCTECGAPMAQSAPSPSPQSIWPDAGTGCSPAGASGFDAVAPKFQHGECTYFDIVDGARQRWRCAAAFRWVCRKEDIAGGRHRTGCGSGCACCFGGNRYRALV